MKAKVASGAASPLSPEQDQEILATMLDPKNRNDVLRWVRLAFPWGEANTPLHAWKEPKRWQCEFMDALSDHIEHNTFRSDLALTPEMWRSAVCAGRGPGKSALEGMLMHWFRSTRIGGTGIVAANNEAQLRSRFWPEFQKWSKLAVNAHWFDSGGIRATPRTWFERLVEDQLKISCDYYYVQGQLWDAENPDAFAGVHNPHGIFLLFEESSGIEKVIFNVAEGFFTDPVLDRFWMLFSNGRRNTGGFFDAFNDEAARWPYRMNIDIRDVEGIDQGKTQKDIDYYGIDSNHVRIEILGQFPTFGERQFISWALCDEASDRHATHPGLEPLKMGIDVARYGNDDTVFFFRKGLDARTIPPVILRNKNNVEVAAAAAEWANKTGAHMACDSGQGTGVIDMLRANGFRVDQVDFSGSPRLVRGKIDIEPYDRRTELYGQAREWLRRGGCLNGQQRDLKVGLTAYEYEYRGDKIKLEAKELLRKRLPGIKGLDLADAFAISFAPTVADENRLIPRAARKTQFAKGMDYSIHRGAQSRKRAASRRR